MNDGLIGELLVQHEQLVTALKQIEDISEAEDPSYASILDRLHSFSKLFIGHIYTENKGLYPKIFENCGNDKGCIASTRRVLEEMKSVQDAIVAFLNKYKSAESLSKGLRTFNSDLKTVIRILRTRIQFEEEVVFKYFEK